VLYSEHLAKARALQYHRGMESAAKIARWGVLRNEKRAWRVRAKAAAKMIEVPGGVMDLGCGNMLVERFLSRRRAYLPVDCVQRDHRTVICDFNTDPLPVVEDCGVLVVLGVLEHLEQPKEFIGKLPSCGALQWVISYHPADVFGSVRGMLEGEFIQAVNLAGFSLKDRVHVAQNILYDFRSRLAGKLV
jgi:hypothetical protein